MSNNSPSASPDPPTTDSVNINLILKKIETLSSEQSKLIDLVNKQIEKLNSFEHRLSDLSLQLLIIKEENNTLRCNLTTLTQRVVSLKISKSTLSENSFSDFIDH